MIMKSRRYLVALTSVFLIAFFCMAALANAAPIELTFVDYDTPTSLSGALGQMIKEEIEKHTEGQVKIKVFWGTSLLKGAEILNGVKDGTVDMGIVNPNYYPGELPLNGVYAILPQGPSKVASLNWLYSVIFERVPQLKAELLNYNQIPLFAFSVLPKAIASTKPIASMSDFKGKKIRASNRWGLAQLEAAGAIPVSVPWSDCFMALQTGTVDAVYTNLDSIRSSKLDEVAGNVFLMRQVWSGTKFIVSINNNTWNSLSKDLQGKIMTAMNSVRKRYGEAYDKKWDEAVKEEKKIGIVVNSLTDEEVVKWVSMPAMENLQKTWIKENEEKGVKNAAEIFEQIKASVREAIERDKN